MDRKNMPIFLMAIAGLITLIVSMVRHFGILEKMVLIFAMMALFYAVGSTIRWVLDQFDEQNEKRRKEAEAAEKEMEDISLESGEKEEKAE